MSELEESILAEIENCRELLVIYQSIPTGIFASRMIEMSIFTAEKACKEQDVVGMVRCLVDLREYKK